MYEELLGGRLIVKVGDVTEEDVDAIVNAANSTLLGGGGVDGAIHNKGGPAIRAECLRIRKTEFPDGLPTGEAVLTCGGRLKARYVIHTVGPIYRMNQGRDAELLASAYKNSLLLAVKNKITTIAFPSISTGAFGYPKPEAASVSFGTVSEVLLTEPGIREVRMVFFGEQDARTFLSQNRE